MFLFWRRRLDIMLTVPFLYLSTAMTLMLPSRNTGPDHPLIRAVEADPAEEASVEVLNFPQAGKGDDSEFDELRSAVVFKRWFNVDQQKVWCEHTKMTASCVCDFYFLKKQFRSIFLVFLVSSTARVLPKICKVFGRSRRFVVCNGFRRW